MSNARPVDQLFDDAPELREVLADLNVRYVRVAANGHWSYEKLGRARHGANVIARGVIVRVAELIGLGRSLRSGDWAIRKVEGVSGPSLLIERLPIAVADRLPQNVLSGLKSQVRAEGNGMLVGEPGSGKSGLLLWLALQIPDQPVLYIAENPPSEFPGTHVMHAFPPANAAERRALERFARLAPVVMWERVTHADELQTLFGFPGAKRRWFTSDATSVAGALGLLAAATMAGFPVELSTVLHLASSVIGRPEAKTLAVCENGEWTEPWSTGESALPALQGTSIVVEAPEEPKVQVAEEFVAEAASVSSPVEHEPPSEEPAAIELDNPHTIEVEDDDIEPYVRNEAVTGMIPREEIRELRERGMIPEDSREMAAHSPPITEQTRAYVVPPKELLAQDVTKAARYLAKTTEADATAPPDVPAVKLEDLRITTMEELDPHELDVLESEIGDLDSDYSEVIEDELDFESIAHEVLSEISEIDAMPDDTAMATNPNQIVLIGDEPSSAISEPDAKTEALKGSALGRLGNMFPTEDPEDSTREFSADRLRQFRGGKQDD